MSDDYDDVETDDAKDTPVNAKEPKSSKGWLEMIADAEKAFKTYQEKPTASTSCMPT